MGKRTILRSAFLGSACALAVVTAAFGQPRPFDIPGGDLKSSLDSYAAQSGVQIVFPVDQVKGVHSRGVKGTLEPTDALEQLLRNTGFVMRRDETGAIAVIRASAMRASDETIPRPPSSAVPESKKAQAASIEEVAKPESNGVEVVTVTAEKQTESSLDVPMGLTALGGDRLERTQSYRMEDFVGKVPGLTLIENGAGTSELVIRGLTTGTDDGNTGVAVYIDETPYTPSSPWASPTVAAPDLDTFDLQRIEVLKGPQGTLYGANALGGLLKYVTNAPDPSGFSAKLEAGASSVYNGSFGFDYHAMVNLPLADDLALRLVGYDNYYPGFIDDPSRGLKDINGSHFSGGRASLLYEPTADFSIRLNVLYQDRKTDDYGAEDVNPVTLTPINGALTQERLIGQPTDATTQLYNVTLNWDVGFARLISTSSYTRSRTAVTIDETQLYGAYTPYFLGGSYGVAYPLVVQFDAFTQEVRLSSEGEGPLQWQAGGYLTHEDSDPFGAFVPINLSNGTLLNDFPINFFEFREPASYRELAGYGNLDYHFTPAFDVALGGRYSENHQSFHEYASGDFSGSISLPKTSAQGVFTYSGDARWHVTPENMLYARIAEGFVPGGPNDTFPGNPLPSAFSSSTTVNYEVGIKSSLLDDHLTAEISAFDIDWRDIQLGVVVNGFSGYDNAGTARSDGMEWSFTYDPVPGLSLNFNGAYTDAHLTQVIPAVVTSVGANAGDPLPLVPQWAGAASADYERPLFGDYSGFVGLDWRFTGSRDANFETSGPRERLPGFSIFDMRAGIETQSWSFTVYVKNLGNQIVIDNLGNETLAGTYGPQSAFLFQPRTIGVTLTANF